MIQETPHNPTIITAKGPDDKTLLTIVAGELRNWGYEVTEPLQEYEPNWGEGQYKIEVKQNGGG
jgi:hypothetical protein